MFYLLFSYENYKDEERHDKGDDFCVDCCFMDDYASLFLLFIECLLCGPMRDSLGNGVYISRIYNKNQWGEKKYMVENSLGRLWLEGHPNEELKSKQGLYANEAQAQKIETATAALK